MNNQGNFEYSPEKRKINYYEENPKAVKKERQRQSLENNKIIAHKENIDEQNIKINFDENIKINPGILNLQNNNFCVSQPSDQNNMQNNIGNNFCMNNILDDFLNELEDEEKVKSQNFMNKNECSIGDELKGMFKRNKYNAYFQTSRTQNQQFSNIWDDFHQKRDKL